MSISMNDLLKKYGPAVPEPDMQAEQQKQPAKTNPSRELTDLREPPAFSSEFSGGFDTRGGSNTREGLNTGGSNTRGSNTGGFTTREFITSEFNAREEVTCAEETGIFGAGENMETGRGRQQVERRGWGVNRIRNLLSGLFRRTGSLPELWWADLIFGLLTIFGIFRIVTNLDQVIYCIFQLICGFLTIAIIGLVAVGIILILYFALRRRRW